MLNNWNIQFWEYDFQSANWLWLLLLIPIIWLLLFRAEKRKIGELKFSGSSISQKTLKSNWIFNVRIALITCNTIIFGLFVLALAKPYHWTSPEAIEQKYKNGIDIILAMDVSVSMLAMDFEPNRLEASKRVAMEFIAGRKGD